MRVIYRKAEQGHLVPRQVLEARGPFQRYEPGRVEDSGDDPDLYPPGATSQNGMTEVVFYECRLCHGIVREPDLSSHDCEE